MPLIRSILHMLWLVLTVIPWALFVVVASLFVSSTTMYWMCARWLKLSVDSGTFILGIKNRITGMENLPTGEKSAAVLLCKHQSTWEALTMPAIMPHPLAYVFKKELLYIPFFGWAMARMDMIHIDRSKRAQALNLVAAQGREFMAKGHWVIMFPEGTRAARGAQGTYKSGGTRLAIATDRPVLPIAVTSARCWPRKSFVLRPGVIDISIGTPIASTGREPDELMREVEDWIEGEMRRLDPEAYLGQPPLAAAGGRR